MLHRIMVVFTDVGYIVFVIVALVLAFVTVNKQEGMMRKIQEVLGDDKKNG